MQHDRWYGSWNRDASFLESQSSNFTQCTEGWSWCFRVDLDWISSHIWHPKICMNCKWDHRRVPFLSSNPTWLVGFDGTFKVLGGAKEISVGLTAPLTVQIQSLWWYLTTLHGWQTTGSLSTDALGYQA